MNKHICIYLTNMRFIDMKILTYSSFMLYFM